MDHVGREAVGSKTVRSSSVFAPHPTVYSLLGKGSDLSPASSTSHLNAQKGLWQGAEWQQTAAGPGVSMAGPQEGGLTPQRTRQLGLAGRAEAPPSGLSPPLATQEVPKPRPTTHL